MIELPVLPSNPSRESGSQSRFWRSQEHLRGDASHGVFTGGELMPEAAGPPGETSRRQFMRIMGASMALAGLTACRKPVEAIMPFARKPEEMIPGVPVQYATGMEFRGTLRPLLVESTDGRPTKIEGNPDHPESLGTSGVFEQAALLGLYDPDRSRVVLHDGLDTDWNAFVRFVAERYARRRTERFAVVTRPSSSMTRAALRARMEAAWPNLRWIEYDPAAGGDSGTGGDTVVHTRFHFDRARVVLSLDRDFLGTTDPDHLHNTASYARSRAVDEVQAISRLYVAESGYSITGGAADHRRAVRRADLPSLARAVARRVGVDIDGTPGEPEADPWVVAVADDLLEAGRRALVIAGDDPATGAVAHAMNAVLGSIGTTLELLDTGTPAPGTDSASALAALQRDMLAGDVDVLLVLDANPAYDLPGALRFADAMSQVPTTIHAGMHVDETAAASGWHVPLTHFLEAWSDGRAFGGTMSVVQPLIAPLYESAHSVNEILGVFASGIDRSGYDLVRETWRPLLAGDFEAAWRRVIHDGFLHETGFVSITPDAVNPVLGPDVAEDPADGIEIVFRPDSKTLDGSFANNAWLQELPDAVTKVVWDNVAAMSPATADSLGVRVELRNGHHYADRVRIAVGDESVDLPVWIVPGMARDTVHVTLGYGRRIASRRPRRSDHIFDLDHETDIYGHGAIAEGVGVSVSPIRPRSLGMHVGSGVTVERSGEGYPVASTQDHGTMPDEGAEAMDRGLYRIASLEEYRANPRFVADSEPAPIREDWDDYPALWQNAHPADQPAAKDNPYQANQWGMVIDLNACTGCNACLVACQAENNIQVVGKDQVGRGREMHWIRLDRYFVGDGAEPSMAVQPVPCMHCENAPCESVCPVAATVHSPDGTNQMIYNRCIGTRYCANNCPYKVRRFNYYNWTKTLPESLHLAQNPNVTVRSRGVMEKCSYCIQRVREANRRSNIEERPIRDGEVRTACQQACPAGAIVFGDLADDTSAVSAARRNPRRYELLAELSVKPRTSYLGRIRNPNPRLEA